MFYSFFNGFSEKNAVNRKSQRKMGNYMLCLTFRRFSSTIYHFLCHAYNICDHINQFYQISNYLNEFDLIKYENEI